MRDGSGTKEDPIRLDDRREDAFVRWLAETEFGWVEYWCLREMQGNVAHKIAHYLCERKARDEMTRAMSTGSHIRSGVVRVKFVLRIDTEEGETRYTMDATWLIRVEVGQPKLMSTDSSPQETHLR